MRIPFRAYCSYVRTGYRCRTAIWPTPHPLPTAMAAEHVTFNGGSPFLIHEVITPIGIMSVGQQLRAYDARVGVRNRDPDWLLKALKSSRNKKSESRDAQKECYQNREDFHFFFAEHLSRHVMIS